MYLKKSFLALFLLVILFFSLSTFALAGEVQEFNWKKRAYKVKLDYDLDSNVTFISLTQSMGSRGEKVLQMPRPANGCVQALIVPDFFGRKRDAVAFMTHEGNSSSFMSYKICFLDGNDLRTAKSEQRIIRGDLIADGNILQLWSGVRMWILYCPKTRLVVKEFVPWLKIQKVGDKIGDRIVEFKIENGEVIFANPSILGEGLWIKSGHDLMLQRTDFNSQGEKVEFVGKITMNVKYPNTFTILSANCEFCIMPDGDPLKEKRFKLVTVK